MIKSSKLDYDTFTKLISVEDQKIKDSQNEIREKGLLSIFNPTLTKEQNKFYRTKFNIQSPCTFLFCKLYGDDLKVKESCEENYPNSTIDYISILFVLYNKYRILNDVDLFKNNDMCNLYDLEMPSLEWMVSQKRYIDKLTEGEREFIRLYTKHGDEFINGYIRSNKITDKLLDFFSDNLPSFMDSLVYYKLNEERYKSRANFISFRAQNKKLLQKELTDYAEFFLNVLRGNIFNSPATDKDIVVYRGFKNVHRNDKRGVIYQNKGFTSTSLLFEIATRFATTGNGTYGYIETILIPKGSKILLNTLSEFLPEFEILLSDTHKYKIIYPFEQKSFIYKKESFGSSTFSEEQAHQGIVQLIPMSIAKKIPIKVKLEKKIIINPIDKLIYDLEKEREVKVNRTKIDINSLPDSKNLKVEGKKFNTINGEVISYYDVEWSEIIEDDELFHNKKENSIESLHGGGYYRGFKDGIYTRYVEDKDELGEHIMVILQ